MTVIPIALPRKGDPRKGDVVVVVRADRSCSLAHAESVKRGIVTHIRHAGEIIPAEQFERLWTLTGDDKQRVARKVADARPEWDCLEAVKAALLKEWRAEKIASGSNAR